MNVIGRRMPENFQVVLDLIEAFCWQFSASMGKTGLYGSREKNPCFEGIFLPYQPVSSG
jgi:hypothetical protein